MNRIIPIFFGFAVQLGLTAHALCQSQLELAAKLHAADGSTSLDVQDVKPWHLKINLQIFDEKGLQSNQGTIEEWWNGPGIDRRQYVTNIYSATEVRNGLNLWRTKGQAPPPYYLELLREQATHPMPKAGDIEGTVFVQQKVPFGKVSLNCITLSQPFLPTKLVPVGLFPMYCFDPDKDLLRASFEFGKQTVLLNNLILFQQRVVARGIAVLQGTDKIAVAEIPTLELSQAPDSMFVAGDDLTKEPPGPVRVSSGTMSGALASRVEPIYPDTAKKDHISGVVVLRAVIGPDGHVHSLKIVSAPRADLAMAAVAAIQQWVYKPYLLLDVPTDVETTINVAFVLSPGY